MSPWTSCSRKRPPMIERYSAVPSLFIGGAPGFIQEVTWSFHLPAIFAIWACSGPGGYVCAIRAGQNGLKTVVIERDARVGGTCTLRGCIPTKAVLHSADVLEEARHGADIGVKTSGVELDMNTVRKFKEDVAGKS